MKQFFLILVSIFFLGACSDSEDKSDPTQDSKPPVTESENGQEVVIDVTPGTTPEAAPGTTPEAVPAVIPVAQECPKNLLTAEWVCKKEGNQTFVYSLNQNPSTVGLNQELGVQQKRVCELFEKSNSNPVALAYNNKDYCINSPIHGLNAKIADWRSKGFECERTSVTYDQTESAGSCV